MFTYKSLFVGLMIVAAAGQNVHAMDVEPTLTASEIIMLERDLKSLFSDLVTLVGEQTAQNLIAGCLQAVNPHSFLGTLGHYNLGNIDDTTKGKIVSILDQYRSLFNKCYPIRPEIVTEQDQLESLKNDMQVAQQVTFRSNTFNSLKRTTTTPQVPQEPSSTFTSKAAKILTGAVIACGAGWLIYKYMPVSVKEALGASKASATSELKKAGKHIASSVHIAANGIKNGAQHAAHIAKNGISYAAQTAKANAQSAFGAVKNTFARSLNALGNFFKSASVSVEPLSVTQVPSETVEDLFKHTVCPVTTVAIGGIPTVVPSSFIS
ncbi:hypothetical protein J120_02215 [candidate division TM6 bacterium JCVI TM6SC1]|uniref:DUF5667 domain-containing protein n=1 Tax=candidate division TM6 bacterium JCVI TM6SC1 TaxID=1306947 RepID=A0A0D2JDQ7_9BACT|nr:hypothetical protein J120_02215 [candidate division TM6 bacterium JCVI TM6SC1]